MLVSEFSDTCFQYENFMVWEVTNLDDFFSGNATLPEIFADYYKFPINELKERRNEIPENDLHIMNRMLANIDDKHFFIFTIYDENHLELIKMQRMKIMNFGLDIEKIKSDKVYIVIMDKNQQIEHSF